MFMKLCRLQRPGKHLVGSQFYKAAVLGKKICLLTEHEWNENDTSPSTCHGGFKL